MLYPMLYIHFLKQTLPLSSQNQAPNLMLYIHYLKHSRDTSIVKSKQASNLMLYIHYLKHSWDTSIVKSKTSTQSYAVHPLLKTFKRHFHCQVKNKHPILCCISIHKNIQKMMCHSVSLTIILFYKDLLSLLQSGLYS